MPFVAYMDESTGQSMVKKFDGTSWSAVGTNPISTRSASDIDIAIDTGDNLYIVYGDGEQSLKVTVKKFIRGSSFWETVGAPGFSDGSINSSSTISIAVDSNSIPHTAYLDRVHSNKATVKKYNKYR